MDGEAGGDFGDPVGEGTPRPFGHGYGVHLWYVDAVQVAPVLAEGVDTLGACGFAVAEFADGGGVDAGDPAGGRDAAVVVGDGEGEDPRVGGFGDHLNVWVFVRVVDVPPVLGGGPVCGFSPGLADGLPVVGVEASDGAVGAGVDEFPPVAAELADGLRADAGFGGQVLGHPPVGSEGADAAGGGPCGDAGRCGGGDGEDAAGDFLPDLGCLSAEDGADVTVGHAGDGGDCGGSHAAVGEVLEVAAGGFDRHAGD